MRAQVKTISWLVAFIVKTYVARNCKKFHQSAYLIQKLHKMRDEWTMIYTIHLTVMLNSELREFCVMKENDVSSLTSSDIDINLALPESLKILNWKTRSLDNKNTMKSFASLIR